MLKAISSNNLITSNKGYILNNNTVNYILAAIKKQPKKYFVSTKNLHFEKTLHFEVNFESNNNGFYFITAKKVPTNSYLNVQIHNSNQKALFVTKKHKAYIIAQLLIIHNNIVW